MNNPIPGRIRTTLEKLGTDGLLRSNRVVASRRGSQLRIGPDTLTAFCSNDYLGLADHPAIAQALIDGANRWGTGSGAAHLISGHSAAHQALEEELADFLQRPRALLFSTGYMANLGVINALCERGDTVIEDRVNHASLLDAALLSRANLKRYRHADADDARHRANAAESGARLMVTDGVFSMDGDLAPLPALTEVAAATESWLMVDDAHGIGALGAHGRGTLEHFGINSEVTVLMGTLGKALGTAGAFVAGESDLIEFLINKARPYIYTTAQPPAVAEATRVALRLTREQTWRRDKLRALIQRFRSGATGLGLPLMDSPTAIQPIVVGSATAATQASRELERSGFLVTAIRPPTVPRNTARLRVTLSAAHEEQDVDRLLDALGALHPDLFRPTNASTDEDPSPC